MNMHPHVAPIKKQVTVENMRSLPYPYKAGVAISNDAEFMSPEFFEGLMAFLNSTGLTPLGSGLGLEVTSSAFFYSAHPYSFSYFEGAVVGGRETAFAARMEEYLRAGWIDTLHAYGDFDGLGGFQRAHAERTFDVLARMGATLPIYTNHGDSANVQNIGGDAAYHLGDVPGTTAYHTDLLKAHGVRYIWTDSAVTGEPPVARGGLRRFVPTRKTKTAPAFMADWMLRDGNTMQRFVRFRGYRWKRSQHVLIGLSAGQVESV